LLEEWYKLYQFGYEALSKTLVSILLEKSNVEKDTPFILVRYEPTRAVVLNRERTGRVRENFLKKYSRLLQ